MPTPREPTEPGDRIGCDECWPSSPEAAWDARRRLTDGPRLVDDSHFGVRLLTCPRCRQEFVSLFVEIVDWVDGDDSQYWTLVPLTRAEVDALTQLGERVTEATVRQLAHRRRCLQRDYPKGESPRVRWA